MAFVFDPDKSEWNRRERGLPFDKIEEMDCATAYVAQDDRKDYGEPRFRTFGLIEGAFAYRRVHAPRRGHSHYQLEEGQREGGEDI